MPRDGFAFNMPTSTPFSRRERQVLLVADLVESVRHFEADEFGTATGWRHIVDEVRGQMLRRFAGRLVKSLGDGLLLEFESLPASVKFAFELQEFVGRQVAASGAKPPLVLRIGIHQSDILADDLDIYGAGVNLCVRLTSLAGPGEVVTSAVARDQLIPGLDADIDDLGECFVKHMSHPIRAFRLRRPGAALPPAGAYAASVDDLRPVVAVFPMRGTASHDVSDVLGEVLSDEINAALSTANDLNVISRLSIMAFRGRDIGLSECRQCLNAHYILSGSYRTQADLLILVVELAESRSERVVWSESLRGSARGVLVGDDGLVVNVAARVRSAITLHELDRARSKPIPSLESYALMLSAISFIHRSSRTDFERAQGLLADLRERHARQAVVHAWAAMWHTLRVAQGWSGTPALDSQYAQDAARRAIDLDDQNALALAIDGAVNTSLLKRLDIGAARYEAAVSANPNEPLAWALKGALHAFRGESSLAVSGTRRALLLSPLDPLRYFYETLGATAELSAGNYPAAISLAQQSLKGNRTHTSTYRAMAIAQVELGQLDDAARTVAELMQIDPGFTVTKYRSWTPSIDFETGKRWASALLRAGVPA